MISNLEKKTGASNSLKSNQTTTTTRSNAHENKTKEIHE